MLNILLKIKEELFFLKLKLFNGIDKEDLERFTRSTLDLENMTTSNHSYNDYFKENLNVR